VAYEYDAIIRAQYETLAQQRAQAAADLEAARMSEDSYNVMDASARIVDADVRRAAVDQIANRYVAQQQQPRGNQYGLNQSEVEIARGISGGDPKLTNDERERIYAANKNKLRHMRQTGEYRDDQANQVRR
jgi:hypothetical protein